MKPKSNNSPREIQNFNFGWKFYKGDISGGYTPNFQDDNWLDIDLPHDWSVEGPFDSKWASSTGFLPGGIGWYRKRFTLSEMDSKKKVFLYFEGVYNNSEVWINGVSVGKRPNGYISFYYDISAFLIEGQQNCIAVRVDHSKYADSRWYTGSGIYRNVDLIITNLVFIKIWGIFAHPILRENLHGILEVDLSLRNHRSTSLTVIISNELFYHSKAVGRFEIQKKLAAHEEITISGKMDIENPKLWNPDTPELYDLISSIKEGDKVLDQTNTTIGFKRVHFDAQTGFFINGRSVKLKGVCMHHDVGCLGAAVPKKLSSQLLDLLKEMGCNAIRTSHNAYSPDFYRLCDEKGFLVINEVFDEWELPKKKWIQGWNIGIPGKDGYAEYFSHWSKIDLRDQILRDRNHPCIIMWSIGNEIDYPNDPYTHEILNTEKNPQTTAKYDPSLPHAKRLGEIASELVGIVKQFDKSRPVTAGLASVLMSNETGYAAVLDIVGYNYQEFRYATDHERYPNRILYGSENGMALEAWQAVVENRFVMGQFLWTGIEYLGEAGQFPMKHSISGLIDLATHKKPEYYFRQSLWSDDPMIFLGVLDPEKVTNKKWRHYFIEPHWNWNLNQPLQVIVFSNCQEVELFHNNNSIGIKKIEEMQENELTWDIDFSPGELRAIGRNNGQDVAMSKLKTAANPHKLIVTSNVLTLRANKQDIAYIEVQIVDQDDILVYSAQNQIMCQIDGPIQLLGMEDANPTNIEDYKQSNRHAFKGRLLIYVQSLDWSGKGTIFLSSPGIINNKVEIDVIALKGGLNEE